MPPSIAAAKAGVTTGEWTAILRRVFGEYRAPTGVAAVASASTSALDSQVRERVDALSKRLGRRLKLLVGKPGLDGHSNGAEQIAVKARDSGMEVVYEGIRLTPAQIAHSARDEGVHVVGLSILSGSHGVLVADACAASRSRDRPSRWWSAASSPTRTRSRPRGRRAPRLHAQATSTSRGSWTIVDVVAEAHAVR
jgi:(2R)-ethylmalonyl-CoA mutase